MNKNPPYSLSHYTFDELTQIINTARADNNEDLLASIYRHLSLDLDELEYAINTFKVKNINSVFVPEEILLLEKIKNKELLDLRNDFLMSLTYYFLDTNNKDLFIQAAHQVKKGYSDQFKNNPNSSDCWHNSILIHQLFFKYTPESSQYYDPLKKLYAQMGSFWPDHIDSIFLNLFYELPEKVSGRFHFQKEQQASLQNFILEHVEQQLSNTPDSIDDVILALHIYRNYELQIPEKTVLHYLNIGINSKKEHDDFTKDLLKQTYAKAAKKFNNQDFLSMSLKK